MKFVVTSVLPFPSHYNTAFKRKICEEENEPNPLLAKLFCFSFVWVNHIADKTACTKLSLAWTDI